MARVDQILCYTSTQQHTLQILVYNDMRFIIVFHAIAVIMNGAECLGDTKWQGLIRMSLI